MRRDIRLLYLLLLLVASGNAAIHSILPAVARNIAVSDLTLGVIFSLSALAWTVTAPVWAGASDRRGRRALILFGLGGFATSTALCALALFAALTGAVSLLLGFIAFAAARTLYGLVGSALYPAAQAFAADRTTPAERTRMLSLLASTFGLGAIVGPAVAPLLIFPGLQLAGPLFAFALLAAIMFLIAWRHLPAGQGLSTTHPIDLRTGTTKLRHSWAWRDPRIFPFVLFGFIMANAHAASIQTLGFLVIDRTGLHPIETQPYIGLVLTSGAVAALSAQLGLIPLLGMRPRHLLRWGAAIAAAGSVLLAFAATVPGMAAAFALASLGYGLARPGFSAGASLAVGPEDQARAAGVTTAVQGAAFVLAPLGGIALYQLAPPLPYLLSAATLIAMWAYAMMSPSLAADPTATRS